MRLVPVIVRAALLFAAAPLSAFAAPFAYVSNEGSASVSVIDTATDTVTATFNVGRKPRGIAISRDGKTLFVSDQASNAALTVDAATGASLGHPAADQRHEAGRR